MARAVRAQWLRIGGPSVRRAALPAMGLCIFMFTTPAYAQTAGAASDGGAALLFNIVPIILVFVIFYFLMFRPQQQAAKAQRDKLNAVKKGDTVVTGGGVIGKVTKVEDAQIEVEIATGVKVKVLKAMLADVTPLGGAKPAND
jgi:preprotein translocase subunit YajC